MLTSFGAIKLCLTLYASILTISSSTAQYQLCVATHIDCTRNVVILMFGKTIFPTESLMRGFLCHLLLVLVPYIVLSALYSTGRLRKLPCVCLVSICHMLYVLYVLYVFK